jgi:hypothetical protein
MKIIGIHGIGQTYLGAEQLKPRWFPALQDGLKEAGSGSIQLSDFEMVGYGALFRPGEFRNVGTPKIEPEELDDWERQMLAEWWREAAALSASSRGLEQDEAQGIQSPDFEGRARTPRMVQRALRQLAKSRFFSAIGPERMLLFGLRQVRLFLHDAELKRSVLARVTECVSSETRIIIAHSLGSIIAYEFLCATPLPNVDTLITIGSPLGIRNLIFEALTPKPKDGLGSWPNVRRWINIADYGDIVALQKQLAPLFGQVEDHLVYNGWEAHDATRYLGAHVTGNAIGETLRRYS